MRISNFKYLITDIGGGWSYNHELYAVTPDGKVYITSKFDEDNFNLDTELELDFCGQLDKVECIINNPRPDYAIMDASEITVYEISNKIEIIYNAWDWKNPEFVDKVKEVISDYKQNKYEEYRENKKHHLVGEIEATKEFTDVYKLISTGTKLNTTVHASNFELPYGIRTCKDGVEKHKEFFNNLGESAKEQCSEGITLRDLLINALNCSTDE